MAANTQQTFIIDFDSTLVTIESLDELAHLALEGRADRGEIMRELKDITHQGMTGELSFDQSLSSRLKLFRANKMHVAELITILHRHISPSLQENRAWFRKNADRIYVISGGFVDYILPITRELGLADDHIFANKFIYDEQGDIIGFDKSLPLSMAQGKVKQVRELDLPGKVIMVGDGYTDYEVKRHGHADEFWAFTETVSRPAVTSQASRVVKSFSSLVM